MEVVCSREIFFECLESLVILGVYAMFLGRTLRSGHLDRHCLLVRREVCLDWYLATEMVRVASGVVVRRCASSSYC